MTTLCNIIIQKFKTRKRRIYSWQIGTPTIYKQSNENKFNFSEQFQSLLELMENHKRVKYIKIVERELNKSLEDIFELLSEDDGGFNISSQLLKILNNLDDEDNYEEIYENSDSYLSEE